MHKSDEQLKRQVKLFYDDDGATYFATKTGLKNGLYRVREIANRKFTDEPLVLELGCGRGGGAAIFGRYIGLDISLYALRRHPNGSQPVQADMENVPLEDESVDVIISIAALEHVPNPEIVLAEIDRLLKKRGICYLAPAWFCRPWASKGLTVKSYSELSFRKKLEKVLISVRDHIIWRGLTIVPKRFVREAIFALRRSPLPFTYRSLKPNLTEYLCSDSDAFSSMDPHSAILYFLSRGYLVFSSSFWNRIFYRHKPVVAARVN